MAQLFPIWRIFVLCVVRPSVFGAVEARELLPLTTDEWKWSGVEGDGMGEEGG